MESWFLLNIVVSQSSSVFQLLSSENESLLVWENSLFVLDLSLDIFNWIRLFNVQGNGFSSQSLDENLHTSSQSKNQVESWFLLNIVVSKGSSVFQLLSSEDKSLLVWGNSLFVLDLGLDIFDWIRLFNIQSDGFSGQSLDENLHTSS